MIQQPISPPDLVSTDDAPEKVTFFGIDPSTGGYLRPPKTWQEIRDGVISMFRLRARLPDVAKAKKRAEQEETTTHRGRPPQGVDAKDLASAGWGVVFAEGVSDEVKAALQPLLDHREAQAGSRFKRFDGSKVLPEGTRAADWLAHCGVGPGVGDPHRVPYYLMIVGTPEVLSFGVEFDLTGSSYAVGRLSFDTPEAYGRYAQNVIAAETGMPRLAKPRLSFLGMRHPDDVTQESLRDLVLPLEKRFSDVDGWEVSSFLEDEATKACAAQLLGGAATPSILFSAGHALGPGPKCDLERVGALLCAPYPGPQKWTGGPLPEEWIYSGRDVPDDADLRGLVAVLFGCFSAGMPPHDSFCLDPPRPLGDGRGVMSGLAAKLLSHERGALAVLGHIDRAWTYSYRWRNSVAQPYAFQSVLGALLGGEPIGAAASYLGDRHNALVRDLLELQVRALRGKDFDVDRFVGAWMSERDARAYLVYGDPAVRPVSV